MKTFLLLFACLFSGSVFAQTILQPVLVTTWIAPMNTGYPAFVTQIYPSPWSGCVAAAPSCVDVFKFKPNVSDNIRVSYFPNRAAAQATGIASSYPIAVPVGQ